MDQSMPIGSPKCRPESCTQSCVTSMVHKFNIYIVSTFQHISDDKLLQYSRMTNKWPMTTYL